MTAWHELGAIGLCSEGGMIECKVADRTVVLWCLDGEYHAVEGICPHMKGHLAKGKLAGTVVTCPGHGSRFDLLTGENLEWPKGLIGKVGKPRTLEIYPVKVVDKRVMVLF